MIVLYTITRVITFFGAVLRNFWEHIACRLCKVPIEDTRVFKVDELCGHVEHEIPEKLSHSFTICFIPFFMNFILGSSFLLTGSYRLFFIGDVTLVSSFALVWLGFSFLANCTPSFEDVLSFKDNLYSNKNKLAKIILSPFFAVCFVCAYLEKFSVTVILSAVVTFFFPQIFNLLFPILDWIDQMVF